MDFKEVLDKIIAYIVECIDKTEDIEQLKRYEKILNYMNMLIGVERK